jgi:hypothetical protein
MKNEADLASPVTTLLTLNNRCHRHNLFESQAADVSSGGGTPPCTELVECAPSSPQSIEYQRTTAASPGSVYLIFLRDAIGRISKFEYPS